MHDDLFQHWKNIFGNLTIYRKLVHSSFMKRDVINVTEKMSKNSIIPFCRILDITNLLNKTGSVATISFRLEATKGYSFELFVLDRSTALKKRRLLYNILSYTGPTIGTSNLYDKQKMIRVALRLQHTIFSEARIEWLIPTKNVELSLNDYSPINVFLICHCPLSDHLFLPISLDGPE